MFGTKIQKAFDDACILRNINRNGRMIVFTFERHNEFFTIEVMGTWSDDVDHWKALAGLK